MDFCPLSLSLERGSDRHTPGLSVPFLLVFSRLLIGCFLCSEYSALTVVLASEYCICKGP